MQCGFEADLEGDERKMNGRQAARAANKRIQELEASNAMYARDIKDYNAVVLDMIAGKSPCGWCENNRLDECEHASRGSAGCSEWWLKYPEKVQDEGGDPDGEAQTSEGPVLNLEKP